MTLPVNLFKANYSISSDANLAKNLFSYLNNHSVSHSNHTNEEISVRLYYQHCLTEYLINEFKLTGHEVNQVTFKRNSPAVYNSFRSLQKLLRFLRHDLQFDNALVRKFLLYTISIRL